MLFGALLFYLYFRGAGSHGLIDPVEGVNASVALHMSAGGSYFLPKMGEILTAGRSLGTWWLEALALKIFGWSEFAVRFWSTLAGLGIVAASVLSARQNDEDSERKGWLAAVISASMSVCFVSAQIASSNAIYSCLTGFAMTGIILSQRNKNWLILSHAVSSFAFIAHGPEGIIFTWLSVISYSVLCDDWDLLKDYFTWPAGTITGVIISGFYLVMIIALNPNLLYFMTFQNQIYSFGGIVGAVIFAFIAFAPFHGFIIRAVREILPSEYPAERSTEIFMLVWAGVFFLGAVLEGDVMSLASCVPALSAIVARRLDSWLEQDKLFSLREAVMINTLILVPALFIILPFFTVKFPVMGASLMSLIPWLILTGLFLLACWYYTRTRQIKKWVRNVSAAALLCLMPLSGVFNLTSEIYSIDEIGLKLRDLAQGTDRIIQYGVNYQSIYFYTFRNSELIEAPLTAGVDDWQFTTNSERLNSLWSGSERVFLIMAAGTHPNNFLPGNNIFHILDAQGMTLLSNK